jgi:hypothetical protein
MAGRLGTVHFKAFDRSDVFLVAEVLPIEYPELDEVLGGFMADDLEIDGDWVTGRTLSKTNVEVDGDTRNIQCVYRAEEGRSYTMTVYVEYEEVEEVSHEPIIQTDTEP